MQRMRALARGGEPLTPLSGQQHHQKPYTVRSTQPPKHVTPAKLPAGKHVFYSNFYFNNPTGVYQANGFLILGPLNIDFGGATQWEAQSFTPTTGGTVNEIDVPLQSFAEFGNPGDNQQNVSLNADDGAGNPGAVIYQKTVKNLPVFPVCCSFKKIFIPLAKQPVITAGTQYWITVTTNTTGTGANTEGVWMFTGSSTNEFNGGSGWGGPSQQFGTNAFAVLGHR
jgi:hypothetical protein